MRHAVVASESWDNIQMLVTVCADVLSEIGQNEIEIQLKLQALAEKVLAAWMLQDLRRFVMLDFSSIRPYLISAMSNWARADRLKYAYLDSNGKVRTSSTVLYSALKRSHSWSIASYCQHKEQLAHSIRDVKGLTRWSSQYHIDLAIMLDSYQT